MIAPTALMPNTKISFKHLSTFMKYGRVGKTPFVPLPTRQSLLTIALPLVTASPAAATDDPMMTPRANINGMTSDYAVMERIRTTTSGLGEPPALRMR